MSLISLRDSTWQNKHIGTLTHSHVLRWFYSQHNQVNQTNRINLFRIWFFFDSRIIIFFFDSFLSFFFSASSSSLVRCCCYLLGTHNRCLITCVRCCVTVAFVQFSINIINEHLTIIHEAFYQ